MNPEGRTARASDVDVFVLVIDDNPDWAGFVAQLFNTQAGAWHAECVGSLAEGIQRQAERRWDLLMLDLNLPDSRGLDTLHRMREAAPGTAILVMTGDVEEDLANRALRAGAQDYLIKGSLNPNAILRIAHFAFERMKADLQVRASRQLLASTLDALPACIAILDQDGCVRATNSRWSRYDNPGNGLIDGCSEGTNYLAACDRAQGKAGTISVVAAGILQIMSGLKDRFSEDYSVPFMTGNAWHEISATRFTDQTGVPTVVVSHVDISERKELEGKLRVSEELLSLISSSVVDLMAIIDASGRRLYTSPSYATCLGYSRDEMQSLSSTDLMHPDERPRMEASLKSLFAGQATNALEYRLRHRDGRYLHFESRGSLIPAERDAQARALIVARDVTERKLAEQEKARMEMLLRQSQKLEAIGQLAAGIAHEINTPIQYIGDNAVFLRDVLQDLLAFVEDVAALPLDHAQFLKRIQDLDIEYLKGEVPKAIQQSLDGVGRVSRIVSAMKDFSHPGGEFREVVDLNRAIESTATVSHNEWKYVAALELDLDPGLPPVPCFPGEFNQVILNLIVNAAHAIDEARQHLDPAPLGRIGIRTRLLDSGVEIRISDTGTGIPDAIRGRIFDPFFTTKPLGKGTGQGLAIAHAVIVEKHGGRLSVDSQVGLGSTFIIELPLHPRERP